MTLYYTKISSCSPQHMIKIYNKRIEQIKRQEQELDRYEQELLRLKASGFKGKNKRSSMYEENGESDRDEDRRSKKKQRQNPDVAKELKIIKQEKIIAGKNRETFELQKKAYELRNAKTIDKERLCEIENDIKKIELEQEINDAKLKLIKGAVGYKREITELEKKIAKKELKKLELQMQIQALELLAKRSGSSESISEKIDLKKLDLNALDSEIKFDRLELREKKLQKEDSENEPGQQPSDKTKSYDGSSVLDENNWVLKYKVFKDGQIKTMKKTYKKKPSTQDLIDYVNKKKNFMRGSASLLNVKTGKTKPVPDMSSDDSTQESNDSESTESEADENTRSKKDKKDKKKKKDKKDKKDKKKDGDENKPRYNTRWIIGTQMEGSADFDPDKENRYITIDEARRAVKKMIENKTYKAGAKALKLLVYHPYENWIKYKPSGEEKNRYIFEIPDEKKPEPGASSSAMDIDTVPPAREKTDSKQTKDDAETKPWVIGIRRGTPSKTEFYKDKTYVKSKDAAETIKSLIKSKKYPEDAKAFVIGKYDPASGKIKDKSDSEDGKYIFRITKNNASSAASDENTDSDAMQTDTYAVRITRAGKSSMEPKHFESLEEASKYASQVYKDGDAIDEAEVVVDAGTPAAKTMFRASSNSRVPSGTANSSAPEQDTPRPPQNSADAGSQDDTQANRNENTAKQGEATKQDGDLYVISITPKGEKSSIVSWNEKKRTFASVSQAKEKIHKVSKDEKFRDKEIMICITKDVPSGQIPDVEYMTAYLNGSEMPVFVYYEDLGEASEKNTLFTAPHKMVCPLLHSEKEALEWFEKKESACVIKNTITGKILKTKNIPKTIFGMPSEVVSGRFVLLTIDKPMFLFVDKRGPDMLKKLATKDEIRLALRASYRMDGKIQNYVYKIMFEQKKQVLLLTCAADQREQTVQLIDYIMETQDTKNYKEAAIKALGPDNNPMQDPFTYYANTRVVELYKTWGSPISSDKKEQKRSIKMFTNGRTIGVALDYGGHLFFMIDSNTSFVSKSEADGNPAAKDEHSVVVSFQEVNAKKLDQT
jgi:hypothetical protein